MVETRAGTYMQIQSKSSFKIDFDAKTYRIPMSTTLFVNTLMDLKHSAVYCLQFLISKEVSSKLFVLQNSDSVSVFPPKFTTLRYLKAIPLQFTHLAILIARFQKASLLNPPG